MQNKKHLLLLLRERRTMIQREREREIAKKIQTRIRVPFERSCCFYSLSGDDAWRGERERERERMNGEGPVSLRVL